MDNEQEGYNGVMRFFQKNTVVQNFFAAYKKISLPAWSVPFVLLGIATLAFGLFVPKLGFYMDDWHFVHYAYTRGLDVLNEVLFYDSRPYGGWLYILLFRLLGFKPLGWHLATFFLRITTATMFWSLFSILWQDRKWEALYTAILFLIYPFFLLQPMSVAYSLHWVGYLCYALSLWLMVLVVRKKSKWHFFFIVSALLLEVIHLFSSEYFSGLEFLRPLILWVLIANQEEQGFYKKLGKTVLHWLPYLLILAFYFLWRFFLFEGPPQGERNAPELLYQFAGTPLKTSVALGITALKDTAIILFSSWQDALAPKVFELRAFFTRFAFLIVVFSVFFITILLNKLKFGNEKAEILPAKKWRMESALLGVVALFTGILPMWVIGKSIATHKNQMAATRFGFASTLGAALLFMLLVEYFIADRKKANLAIALLASLAIGIHLQNANIYEYSWEKQKNLYQQLVWRIPDLAPNTAIISAEEVLPYMGDYPTTYALNTIFPSSSEKTPYWFFSIYMNYPDQIRALLDGLPIEEWHLLSSFSGNSKESLYISYEPGLGQCLWVLRPEDADLRLISDLEQRASQNSALDRILIEEKSEKTLPSAIFGEEMPENWCSYYQRADLARQRGNWDGVVSLWEEAMSNDKRPENGFEYIPFIEGYAHLENWAEAKKLTRNANKVSQGMAPILCNSLFRLEERTAQTGARDAVLADLYDYLACDIE